MYIYIYIYIYKHIYICIVGYKQLQFGVYVTPRLMLAQSLGIADLSFFFMLPKKQEKKIQNI